MGDSELVDDGNRHHKLNNTHISEETMTCAHLKPYLKKILRAQSSKFSWIKRMYNKFQQIVWLCNKC